MSNKKKIKDLTIRDNFMFVAVMMQGELEQFLKFVKNDTSTNDVETIDSYVKQLQNTIRSIKENREMECRYQFAGDMLVREHRRGRLEVRRESILELLEELGTVSKSTYECIMSENKEDVLKVMHKAAAKAENLEQFEEVISNL